MNGNRSRDLLCLTLLVAIHFSLSSYTLMPLSRAAEKKVILSQLPGLHDRPVNISASTPKGTYIVYTKDGNLPVKSSPRWEKDLRFDKTTPLTIGLVVDDQLVDTFYCGTYLIGFRSSLPVTCLILPSDGLLGPENGIYVGGLTPEGKTYGNCWKDIERITFFEFIEKEQPVVAQGCGLKIFGGMTRQNKEKSMRVIARDKYGKGKFKHRFFNTKERDVFNSIVLRTSGNDYLGTRFLDMMISSVAKDIGVDYLAYQPSVLFVNGTYWGIHNLREKINDDYLEENYGVSSDSTDLILGNASAEVGSSKKYRELLQYLDKTPPDLPGYIDSLEQRMDIQNYLNYIILEIQINNIDSRGNVRYWSSSSLDEKFRWVYYDGDLSFGNPKLNYLGKRLSETQTDWYNPNWSTFLLRKMMENKTLRNRFITQYCYLHSTWLSADTFESRINQFHDWLEPEINRHLVRKDFKQSRSGWEGKVKNLKKFARVRDTTSMLHLKESFSLGEMYTLEINANAPAGFYSVWMNGNRLAALPYKGRFFKGVDTRLEIRSIHPLYRFVKWSDGNSNASRPLINNTDTSLIVNAQLKEVPFTRHADKVFFKALATGRKDRLAFIFIMDSTRRHAPRKIFINDRRGELPIEFTLKTNEHQLLICNDAVKFRKKYPLYEGQLIQIQDLRLNNDIQTLYMFAANGDLMDTIQFRGIKGVLNTNIPYYQRDSIYMTGTFEIPTLDPPVFPDADQERKEMYITFWTGLLVSLVLIFGLPFLIIRRKRSGLLILFPLVMACSTLSAQDLLNTPKRHLNSQKLLSNNKISSDLPQKNNCYQFYCAYKPVKNRLIWVAPFAKSDFNFKYPFQEGKQKFYKELPSDDELHPRSLYTGDTVRNFIKGVRVESFSFEPSGKWKLVKVTHANGMESWYYPVSVDGKDVLQTQAGSVLGRSKGTYFWEIRYRERSLALGGILVSDMEPDPKGYFLESGKDVSRQLKERYEGFMRSVNLTVKTSGNDQAVKKEATNAAQ